MSKPPQGGDEPRPSSGLAGLRERIETMTPLEQALWAIVGVLAIVTIAFSLTTLMPGGSTSERPAPAAVAGAPTPTRVPSATPTLPATATKSPTFIPTLEPLVIPTPPSGGVLLTFAPNLDRTGWLGSSELSPHWRDRNLHGGVYQGQALASLVQFDVTSLAPGSKIIYAALEITGRNGKYMAPTGEWKLDLVDGGSLAQPDDITFDNAIQAKALATLSGALNAKTLATGQTNRFIFSPDQIQVLQAQLDSGTVNLRLRGPTEGPDNLFTWDAGPGPGQPTLYVVAVPASFVVITATPVPTSVYAAATRSAKQTADARSFGSPTALPRGFVTATPGATGYVVVTSVPTAANAATATERSVYATAVAYTTGTFTPTPPNFITMTPTPFYTPTPVFMALSQFTPVPTPTARATEVSLLQYAKTPFPLSTGLVGKIAFKTNREGDQPQIWAMDPNGNVVGKFTGEDYFQIASVHELYSPDRLFLLDMDKDSQGKWLIVTFDIAKGLFTPLIQEISKAPGIGVYHPAWSPAGDKVAFVSERTGNSEIYVYDIKTKTTTRLTYTDPDPLTKDWASNKHPSWSPDGKQIVFTTNRPVITQWQVWIMNADGGGLRDLSPSPFSDWDPIWIKW